MLSKVLRISAVSVLAVLAPAMVRAQSAPPSMPPNPYTAMVQGQTLQGVHVWLNERGSKREIASDSVQIAKNDMPGAYGSMGGSMAKGVATSALAIAGGPIGMVAGSVINLFGHHAAPRPTFHMVFALAGQHSNANVASRTPAFGIDYGDTPGIDPAAYTPEVLKLTSTSDNWRLVTTADAPDASMMIMFAAPAGVPVPKNPDAGPAKVTEDRVAAASIQMIGRGQASITFSQPLDPGEYGIVLRPVDTHTDLSAPILRTVWDFSVPGPSAQQ